MVDWFEPYPCEGCGCTGNETCGAKPLGEDCALDECGNCPCCRVIGKEANVKRWKTKKLTSTIILSGFSVFRHRRGAND